MGGLFGGGGGSSAPSTPSATSQNVTTSNIAPWAQSGVSDLINAGMGQVFQTNPDGTINTNQMKGYTPFNANTPAGNEWVQGAAGSVAGFSPLQQQAQQSIANMQTPGQYGQAMDMSTMAGLGALGTTGQAGQYGQIGQAAGLAGMQAGNAYGQNATNPNAVAAYMNPYIQNTLNPALQLQNQQFGQQNAANQGQATQQGAFGGGRQAVMQGLNQQNQMLAQNQLVGNAYNQAYNTANQNMQTAGSQAMQGAGLGITGANTGLQGVGAQQAGYGQLGAQATNLGNLAGAQTQTGLNIAQAQQGAGATQQQNQQNILNQAMANYNTAQTMPMTQLAQLESMYTGAPQNITTSTYSAAPNTVSQLAGLAGTAVAGAKLAGAKAGGSVKDIKKMATGGIAKFAGKGSSLVGGAVGNVDYSLENMDATQLENLIKTSTSPHIRQKAQELLPDAMQRGAGVSGASAGQTNFAAGGGIVAFASRGLVPEASSVYPDGVGNGSGEAFSPEEMYAGENRSTPYGIASGPTSPALKSGMSWIEQLKEMGYGKPTADELASREEIKQERADLKKNRGDNKWLALLAGSGAALENTSPFFGPGIGSGIKTGVQTYGASEKEYADQLKALRSGELDLNKLSSTDRNNLLHYALSGATSEQNAKVRADELAESSKDRLARVGAAGADRQFNAKVSAYNNAYGKLLQARKDVLGVNPLTAQDYADIENQAAHAAERFIQGASNKSDKGDKGNKGGKGVQAGAEKGIVNPADFDIS